MKELLVKFGEEVDIVTPSFGKASANHAMRLSIPKSILNRSSWDQSRNQQQEVERAETLCVEPSTQLPYKLLLYTDLLCPSIVTVNSTGSRILQKTNLWVCA